MMIDGGEAINAGQVAWPCCTVDVMRSLMTAAKSVFAQRFVVSKLIKPIERGNVARSGVRQSTQLDNVYCNHSG